MSKYTKVSSEIRNLFSEKVLGIILEVITTVAKPTGFDAKFCWS